MFRPRFALASLIAALLLLGCGFKGPLVQAPEQPAKKPPAATPAPAPVPAPEPEAAGR